MTIEERLDSLWEEFGCSKREQEGIGRHIREAVADALAEQHRVAATSDLPAEMEQKLKDQVESSWGRRQWRSLDGPEFERSMMSELQAAARVAVAAKDAEVAELMVRLKTANKSCDFNADRVNELAWGIVKLQGELAASHGVLRSLACWLSVGGYNAEIVDPKLFEKKIREGIDTLVKVETERALGPKISDSEKVSLLHRTIDELQAELAALRRPVEKVTEEESAEVHRLLWAIGSGDGFSAMAAAIEKLVEPRVASAVAAEYERMLDCNRTVIKLQDERHTAELAATNKAADDEWIGKFTDMANRLKDDHAAELAKEKKAYDDQAERFRGLQHELLEAKEKHTKELNELKHLHSDAVHKWQQMEKKHTDELSNQCWAMIQEQREADQRWQERLARVEVEHANEIAIMENACKLANNLKDSLDMRTSKAVAAAYEEAARIAEDKSEPTWGHVHVRVEVARRIRQLAAKPQEAEYILCDKCNCPLDDTAFHDEYGCLTSKVAHDTGEDERPPICQVCGWRCAEDAQDGCVPGNCSIRPAPKPHECPTLPEKEAAPILDSDGKKIFGTDGELMTEDDVADDPHKCHTFHECECGLTQAHDAPPIVDWAKAWEETFPGMMVADQFCQDICWRVP